jgi:hypothetical protein
MSQQNYAGNRRNNNARQIVKAEDRKIVDFTGIAGFKATYVKVTVFHAEKSAYVEAMGTLEGGAPLTIGSHYSGVRLTSKSVSAFVVAQGFDPKKGVLSTESKSWVVDPKTGLKKALTSNGEWFDTFEFGSKNGAAVAGGDEDDTFGADAVVSDKAFGA